MKNFGFVILVLGLMASAVVAQNNPTVEIVLSQPTAHLGEMITADIVVRDAVNVGGLDIGITTDDQCLRIVDRQPGSYLPTESEQGAFSALSEMSDHATRFAAALVDRTKYVSGDGVFYQVQLEVTCETGTAALNFTYAQVSSYVDPSAEIIDVISYDLSKNTLNPINAQLTVSGQAATAEIQSTPDSVETVTAVELTAEPETVVEAPVAPEESPVSVDLIVALALLGIFFLGLTFWYFRRISSSDNEDEDQE